MKPGDLVEVDQDWYGMKPVITKVMVTFMGMYNHYDADRDDLIQVLSGGELVWYHEDRLFYLPEEVNSESR